MTTNVYVDAFNLYNGCVKGTPYKWLNIAKLCRKLLPKHTTNRIRYFTALIRPKRNDPQQAQRQQSYIRALETLSNLSVHYGHYLSNKIRVPLVNPLPNWPRTVEVWKTEEKGSDVNLAAYLLLDAFNGDSDVAVVISNDSDLTEPVKIVQDKFGLQVGVFHPHKNTSWALRQVATFYRPIRQGVLRVSQIPRLLTDKNGTITKPASW